MDSKYAGMTVNERLYISGLLNEFDAAVQKKNLEQVRAILGKVELTESNIIEILENAGLPHGSSVAK